MADTALLLIDIQNDYFPGGAMELEGAAAAGVKARTALERFRKDGLPVIHVRHLSTRPGATFFLPGTQAADLGDKVPLLADACATRAQSFGGETIPARQVHGAFLAALNGFYAKVVNAHEL
jgi:nicotinamidase-related amidase